MDEAQSSQEQTVSYSENTHAGRRKQKEGKVRSSTRATKWRNRYKVEQRWTIAEKTRLLEALKRFDPHNLYSIAKLVETKTEEEVEEKIQSLRGIDSLKNKRDRVDAGGPTEAPVEVWIDLIQEMTNYEPADYSQFVPAILGLIARNEKFAESGFPELKWKNIYQFLADITENKVKVQSLTQLESLMVLDLIHNLGTTLLKSDTSEQRQILDFKYQLLNSHSADQIGEMDKHNISQALRNDFWEPEDIQRLLPQTSNATSTSLAMMSDLASKSPASTSSKIAETYLAHTQPGTSAVPSTSFPIMDVTGRRQPDNDESSEPLETTVAESGDESRESSTNKLKSSQEPRKRLMRPKFLTLNPLCVPTQLLDFQPKGQKK